MYISKFRFYCNILYCTILPFYIFNSQFIMGKDIGLIYKHSQSQLSTSSIKVPISSSSEPQTFSAVKLTTTSFPSITEKHQNNSILCSQNTTQNDAIITNNDDILSCEKENKKLTFQQFQHLIVIHNVLLLHTQVYWRLLDLQYYLRLVKKYMCFWRKVNLTRPPGVLNQV